MAGSPELAVLVGVLQRTSSPRERMGVLFRAYKQVKRLSGEERTRLALHLGVDGAVELVEELAERHDALPPKTVLDLLEALRAAPPSSLRTFFRKLRDPKERTAFVSDGLERARRELLGEAEGAPPQPEEAPAEPDTPEEGPPKPVLQAEAPLKEPREPAKLPPTPKRHDPQKPAATAKRPPKSDGPGDGPVPLRRTPAPFPARPVVARRVPFSPPKATTLEPVPPTPAVPLATQFENATTLTARFRLLRAGDAALRTSPLGGLRKILSAFPPGWPRRRALDFMLCTGAPAGLVDAMTLIETLDRPVDRRWCLRGLLRHRKLTEQEAEHVLGAEAWQGRPPRPRGRPKPRMRAGATKASAPFEDVRIHFDPIPV